MRYFLANTEPSSYSIEQLEREKRTTWDGVKNAQAVRAIREMRPHDKVFIYHSGDEPGVVGLARVASEPRDDPKDPKSRSPDSSPLGRWCVKAVYLPWKRPLNSWNGCGRSFPRRTFESKM